MQIAHKKNSAYYLSFPMIDSATPANFRAAATVTDAAYYKDGAGAWTSLAITDTASEIGSTGVYEIDLSAAELNHDMVMIKFTAGGCADTAVLFKMDANGIDDLSLASALTTAQNDLDVITGSDGVTLATAQGNYAPAKQADVATELNTYDAPTKAEMDSAFTQIKGATWSTTDTLENIRDEGVTRDAAITTAQADLDTITGSDGVTLATAQANYAPSKAGDSMALTAGGVDAILDESLSGHNIANSLGRAVRQVNEGVIAIEGSISDVSATVNTFITDLTETSDSHYSDLTLAFIDGNLKGQAKPILSYTGSTKTIVLGEDLTEAPANSDSFIILTTHVHPVSQIVDGVYDRATAGHTTAGTFGKLFADVLTDTNEIQGDWVNGGRLDLILDQIATDTTTDIPATIAALNDITTSDVLTQVNAALDTAITELGVGTPAATPTLRTGLMLLYMALRNKVDVDTTGTDAMKIHNDAGTQIASKLVTDDGTDYSEAKMS